MRQIVKRVKGGEDVTFECSRCGNFIYKMFVPSGKKCEPDCDKIPEKCSCGERLTSRQPIIDEDSQRTNGMRGSVHRSIRDDKRRNVHENQDIYREYIRDLESSISIEYFNMRLNGLKKNGLKIPDNIDNMMMECVKRNIFYVESNVKQLSNKDGVNSERGLQERLNILRQKHSELSKKLEDIKEDNRDINKENNKMK